MEIQSKLLNKIFLIVLIFLFIPFVSSAHFIVGRVGDARDGTLANGKTVVLWNPSVGMQDNLTDIVGSSGNSGTSNVYFIDCELLSAGCDVGDEIRVQIINLEGYNSNIGVLNVSGAGFDVMENLTLNSPPIVTNVSVDDSFPVPLQEIDLNAGGNTSIFCSGIVSDVDGDTTISNSSMQFFQISSSFFGDIDDNNMHYSNSSCMVDISFGNENESFVNCTVSVRYYSNSGGWNCTLTASDNYSLSNSGSNTTNVNTLLALSLPDFINYGSVGPSLVSSEIIANITNVGNSVVNLSLSGYGSANGDGLAMNCSGGVNISIFYQKYNLTAPNSGNLTLSQFESRYLNLTSSSVIKRINLRSRQNDSMSGIDDTNSSFWRIYVPVGVNGNCSGNIVFGATQGAGS